MTAEPIDQVLKLPEGKQLEFKRDFSSPQPLLKTLVAFANTAGGQLFIGISDDGAIVGVDDPLGEEERLGNLISDGISPRLLPSYNGRPSVKPLMLCQCRMWRWTILI